MLHKLEASKMAGVQHLFAKLNYNLRIEAILSGKIPGEVYVDDPVEPSVACIWDLSHLFFVAGNEENQEFNCELAHLIVDQIIPSVKRSSSDEVDYYLFFEDQSSWEEKLLNLLAEINPGAVKRRYYLHSQERDSLSVHLPEGAGYELVQIDEHLFQRTELKNLEHLIAWADTESWQGVDDFLAHGGFGYCVIKDDKIVSWCMADYLFADRCEIGIETDKEYRKQGLATVAVSATVNYCLNNGIRYIGWSCFDNNQGSIGLAEKVGFQLYKQYPVIFGWFNVYDNLIIQARAYYRRKEYEQAIGLFEKAIQLLEGNDPEYQAGITWWTKENSYRLYHHTAKTYAVLGDLDQAISRLQDAVAGGLTDGEMLQDEEFGMLAEREEYQELVKGVRG